MKYVIRSTTSNIIFEDRQAGENLGKEIKYSSHDEAINAMKIFQSVFLNEKLYVKEIHK